MARVLILVENLPSPFDRRVWQDATTLAADGYDVAILCPTGPGCEAHEETIAGIRILRYDLPLEASGAVGYLREYSAALWHTFRLAWREHRGAGFDIAHACNPPDLLFLIAGFFKWYAGTRFVFDHHDISPELYEAKFKRRDFLYRLMLRLERWTFRSADISIATNESYRRIAWPRGCSFRPGRRRYQPEGDADPRRGLGRRVVRDLHRPGSGRTDARDAQHRRRVRQSRRRQRDERQVDDEQGHGVHGARQAARPVRSHRRTVLRSASVAVRASERRARSGRSIDPSAR